MPDVPETVLAELRRICAALPEVDEEHPGGRATFRVGRRVVVSVLTVENPAGDEVTVMTARVPDSELEFLTEMGHPFFRLRSASAKGRIGVVLDRATDWGEIGEIVLDSYLLTAPKRLTRDLGPDPGRDGS